MFSNDIDHSRIWRGHYSFQLDAADSDSSKAATISAEIIRWLPLTAANDFLDDNDGLPPVA